MVVETGDRTEASRAVSLAARDRANAEVPYYRALAKDVQLIKQLGVRETGDEEPIRSEAVFTGRGGELGPRVVRVPAFIAIRVILRDEIGTRSRRSAQRGRLRSDSRRRRRTGPRRLPTRRHGRALSMTTPIRVSSYSRRSSRLVRMCRRRRTPMTFGAPVFLAAALVALGRDQPFDRHVLAAGYQQFAILIDVEVVGRAAALAWLFQAAGGDGGVAGREYRSRTAAL